MWFLLDDFCLINLFLWVLVEFCEIGCFVFVSNVLPVANTLLFGTAVFVVTIVSVAAVAVVVDVVVRFGTIVEILNRVSGSTVWTIVSQLLPQNKLYFLKPLKKVKEVTETSNCLEAFIFSEIPRL